MPCEIPSHSHLRSDPHAIFCSFDSSYLTINVVKVKGTPTHVSPLHHISRSVSSPCTQFNLKPPHPVLGSALVVPLGSKLAPGDKAEVTIEYSTTEQGTAIGWLEKE